MSRGTVHAGLIHCEFSAGEPTRAAQSAFIFPDWFLSRRLPIPRISECVLPHDDEAHLLDSTLTALCTFRIDYQDPTNIDRSSLPLTIRSVFIIDPKKIIRIIISYPASTGRNATEILRVVDSLQASDKYKIATPIDWVPGQDVIVANSVKADEAKQLFPDLRIIKPYLRYTALPQA